MIIYKSKNSASNGPVIRRLFLKELAAGLVKEHLAHRLILKHLPSQIALNVKSLGGVEMAPKKKERTSSGRCEVCPRKKDRKTRTSCNNCGKLICKEHSVSVCEECGGSSSSSDV